MLIFFSHLRLCRIMFTESSSAKKYNVQLAHTFFLSHSARRVFDAWLQCALAQRQKRTLSNIASAFHARSLSKVCFAEWMRRFYLRIETRTLTQACATVRNQHMLQNSFGRWVSRFRDRRLARECEFLHNRNMQATNFRSVAHCI